MHKENSTYREYSLIHWLVILAISISYSSQLGMDANDFQQYSSSTKTELVYSCSESSIGTISYEKAWNSSYCTECHAPSGYSYINGKLPLYHSRLAAVTLKSNATQFLSFNTFPNFSHQSNTDYSDDGPTHLFKG